MDMSILQQHAHCTFKTNKKRQKKGDSAAWQLCGSDSKNREHREYDGLIPFLVGWCRIFVTTSRSATFFHNSTAQCSYFYVVDLCHRRCCAASVPQPFCFSTACIVWNCILSLSTVVTFWWFDFRVFSFNCLMQCPCSRWIFIDVWYW